MLFPFAGMKKNKLNFFLGLFFWTSHYWNESGPNILSLSLLSILTPGMSASRFFRLMLPKEISASFLPWTLPISHLDTLWALQANKAKELSIFPSSFPIFPQITCRYHSLDEANSVLLLAFFPPIYRLYWLCLHPEFHHVSVYLPLVEVAVTSCPNYCS